MKNKKAEILAEEVVKIVLAVVCIIILIILAAGLYGIFTKKTDLEQARATLKEIVAKIDSLGEGGKGEYLVVAPKKWYFLSYNNGICICSEENLLKSMEDCCTKGAHSIPKKSVVIDSVCNFPLAKPSLYEKCISFRDIPMNINLMRNGEVIDIKTEASIKVSNLFNEFLEFKGNEEKTVKDLCIEYVNKLTDMGLVTQITNKVKEFFSVKKESGIFQIIRYEDEGIKLQLFFNEGNEIIGNLQDYTFYQNSLDKKLEIKDSNGKEYSIILKIGEWEIKPGSGGGFVAP